MLDAKQGVACSNHAGVAFFPADLFFSNSPNLLLIFLASKKVSIRRQNPLKLTVIEIKRNSRNSFETNKIG